MLKAVTHHRNTFFECHLNNHRFYFVVPLSSGRKSMVDFLSKSNAEYKCSPYVCSDKSFHDDGDLIERFKTSNASKYLFLKSPIERFTACLLKYYVRQRAAKNPDFVPSVTEDFWFDHFKSSKKHRIAYEKICLTSIKLLKEFINETDKTKDVLFNTITNPIKSRWFIADCVPSYMLVGRDLSRFDHIMNSKDREIFLVNNISGLYSDVKQDTKSVSNVEWTVWKKITMVSWGNFSSKFTDMFGDVYPSLYNIYSEDFELFGEYY